MRAAHQELVPPPSPDNPETDYLSKPTTPLKLRALVNRLCALAKGSKDDNEAYVNLMFTVGVTSAYLMEYAGVLEREAGSG